MEKKNKKVTAVHTYKVTMLVHVIADDAIDARKKLDEQGGIMTQREVEVLNTEPLYGEKETI
jgi:hypothetical protein